MSNVSTSQRRRPYKHKVKAHKRKVLSGDTISIKTYQRGSGEPPKFTQKLSTKKYFLPPKYADWEVIINNKDKQILGGDTMMSVLHSGIVRTRTLPKLIKIRRLVQ
jgi:hypothetical protein